MFRLKFRPFVNLGRVFLALDVCLVDLRLVGVHVDGDIRVEIHCLLGLHWRLLRQALGLDPS